MKKTPLLCIIFLLLPFCVFAHPGNTDNNGCHTCLTNCSSWGLSYGEYHCHSALPICINKPSVSDDCTDQELQNKLGQERAIAATAGIMGSAMFQNKINSIVSDCERKHDAYIALLESYNECMDNRSLQTNVPPVIIADQEPPKTENSNQPESLDKELEEFCFEVRGKGYKFYDGKCLCQDSYDLIQGKCVLKVTKLEIKSEPESVESKIQQIEQKTVEPVKEVKSEIKLSNLDILLSSKTTATIETSISSTTESSTPVQTYYKVSLWKNIADFFSNIFKKIKFW
jgi:hypothetical protein